MSLDLNAIESRVMAASAIHPGELTAPVFESAADVPALVAEVRRLRTMLEALENHIGTPMPMPVPSVDFDASSMNSHKVETRKLK